MGLLDDMLNFKNDFYFSELNDTWTELTLNNFLNPEERKNTQGTYYIFEGTVNQSTELKKIWMAKITFLKELKKTKCLSDLKNHENIKVNFKIKRIGKFKIQINDFKIL